MTIDLNKYHHALHAVTGAMALHFNKATAADLAGWAKALRKIADEMKAEILAEAGVEDTNNIINLDHPYCEMCGEAAQLAFFDGQEICRQCYDRVPQEQRDAIDAEIRAYEQQRRK